MHNRIGFNRLGRKAGHRRALHRNMAASLIRHERIKTTQAKAKAIRRTVEKLITRAKIDTIHNRRTVARIIHEKPLLVKLFQEIGPRFVDRPGGYTRILKLGPRSGDAAEIVILELLKDENEQPDNQLKQGRKKGESAMKNELSTREGETISTAAPESSREISDKKELEKNLAP